MNIAPKDAEDPFSTVGGSQPDRIVVSFSHSDYLSSAAGVEKVIGMEQKHYNDHGIAYFHIYPFLGGSISDDPGIMCIGLNVDGQPTGQYSATQVGDLLQDFSRRTAAEFVALHVHHLAKMPVAIILFFIKKLSPRCVRFFVHDYYSLCPQANLLYNGEMFCDLPAPASLKCCTCFMGRGRRRQLREVATLFAQVSQFIIPSEVARGLFLRVYPELKGKTYVIPHQQVAVVGVSRQRIPARSESVRKIRVAYVGQSYYHKGWETWKRFVAATDPDRYVLYHVGVTSEMLPRVSHVPVSSINSDENAMTRTLQELQVNLAFLWSVCPETYSFTFFESLTAGCFIVTNPGSGNIAEQVRQYSCGVVLADEEALFAYFADAERVKRDLAQYAARVPQLQFNLAALPDEDCCDRFPSRSPLGADRLKLLAEFRDARNFGIPDTLRDTRNFQSSWIRLIKSRVLLCAKWWRDFLLPHHTSRRLAILMALAVLTNPRQAWQAMFCTKSDL